MRESSLVPTNLLDWPRVAPLLPDQKLILQWLWASPYANSIGVITAPPRPAAATLGLSLEAYLTGVKNISDAGLLVIDEETGEMFLPDWYRFHRFSGYGRQVADKELRKIQSQTIRSAVIESAHKAGADLFKPADTENQRLTDQHTTSTHNVNDNDAVYSPGESKQTKGGAPMGAGCVSALPKMVNKGKGNAANKPKPKPFIVGDTSTWPPQFRKLWEQYPKKEALPRALLAWFAGYPTGTAQEQEWTELQAGLARWKGSQAWANDDGRFVPYFCNWLSEGRWTESPAPARKSPAAARLHKPVDGTDFTEMASRARCITFCDDEERTAPDEMSTLGTVFSV